MKKNVLKICFYGISGVFLGTVPAYAQWPTFDVAEVFNTVETSVSQVEGQVATGMETISTANIQQSIGDKLGGLSKIKDQAAAAKAKADKAQKQAKRLEKVKEMKEEYAKKAANAMDTANALKDKGTSAIDQANALKEKGTSAIEQANAYKEEGLNAYNSATSAVDSYKEQADALKETANAAKEAGANKIDSLTGKDTDIQTQNVPVLNEEKAAITNEPLNTRLQNGFGAANSAETVQKFDTSADLSARQAFKGNAAQNDLPQMTKISITEEGNTGDDLWEEEEEAVVITKELPKSLSGTEKTVLITEEGDLFEDEELPLTTDAMTASKPFIRSSGDVFSKTETLTEEIEIENGEPAEQAKKLRGGAFTATGGTIPEAGIKTPADADNTLVSAGKGASETVNTKNAVKNTTVQDNNAGKRNIVTPENNRLQKGFGKVSYQYEYKASYAAQSGEFKTGTDEDGNFYFPDAFATWVGLNYDETADADKLLAAIDGICEDLKSRTNTETQEYSRRFDYEVIGKMRANAMAHSAVLANEAQSGKAVEDLEKTVERAQDTAMTQLSGLGELEAAQLRQNRNNIIIACDEINAKVFDEIRRYCETYKPQRKE